uniref:Exo84_C domain-containing protein n=1 Tax=Mesocestoides corti TaxID=53468 RepID=A0A5K3EZB4_MESCO
MAQAGPNTLAGLRRIFNKPDLDVDKFVNNISKNGGAEILQTISDLNCMAEEASAQMKKAIFNNFKLFIDAGKAVAVLASTMHQLDHQLVEQKRLCAALTEKSLFRDEKVSFSDSKCNFNVDSNISSLLNSVEGVSNLVKDPTRQLLFDADAVELNPTTFMKQGYVHLFVLTDYILVAKKQYDSYAARRYKKQALYEIENVAVTSVKPRDVQKASLNLVQLLVFPDSHVFQLESIKEKRALISTIDEAKRHHVTGNSMEEGEGTLELGVSISDTPTNPSAPRSSVVVCPADVETSCFEALVGTLPEISDFIRFDRKSLDATTAQKTNPFNNDSFGGAHSQGSLNEDAWLWEAPEDVDVAVAIRDFAKAVSLISKARRRLAQLLSAPKTPASSADRQQQVSAAVVGLTKLNERVEQRATNLSRVLEEELTRAADRHSASQSVRAAAIHLSELGKTVLALHLFLTYRSGVIGGTLVRGVRQEGNQLVYLNRLSLAFHRGLVESVSEWNQLIDDLKQRPEFAGLEDVVTSKLCSWVLEETVEFCSQLKVLLIDSRSITFYAMACASERIHAHAKRVTELIGIDIRSAFDNCLVKSWQRAVEEQGRVYRDAVEHRASKEKWQAVSSQTNEMNVKTMVEVGFPEAKQGLNGGKGLTSFTTQSARLLSHFAHACARLDCPELRECIVTSLVNMLRCDLDVYNRVLTASETNDRDETSSSKLILANLQFFVYKVIPKISAKMNCADHLAVMAVTKDFKKLLRESQH